MYKVFFNDNILSFRDKTKTLLKDNNIQVVDIEGFGKFKECFPNNSFMKLSDSLDVVCDEPELIWNAFRNNLHQIAASGGVVTNPESEILFIKRFGRWDLPKGKVEPKEDIQEAAIREVEEECGLKNPKIVRQLPSTFHLYFSPYIEGEDNLVLKETFWFEMGSLGNEKLVPQIEENIEEVRWFKKSELNEVYESTYKNLVELLDNYLA